MRQKKFDKNVKALAATDILCINFFDTWVFLNPRTAPIWNITALWDRIFLKQNRVTAHLRIKKSVPQIFWYIEDFHTKLLALWDKTLWQNRDDPSSVWKFRMQGFFWKTERFSYEIFSSCETKFFDRTLMPSSCAWMFLVPGTFSKHGRVPLRIFSALWNKNKSTENLDAVPPSSPTNFF